jgi:hypothetical protein
MQWPRVRFTVRQMMAVVVVAALLSAAGSLAWRFWFPGPISGTEALRLAEDFIARNGYTDLPVPEGTKLTLEPIEFASNRAERLEIRHDTLERNALAAYPMAGGWIVHFRYKGDHLTDSKRGVWVDDSGKRIHLFHQDVY